MFKKNKEKSIADLKRARWIIGKIVKMMETGEPCQNIMSQNAKAASFLRHAHNMFLEAQMSEKIILLSKSTQKISCYKK